MAASRMMPTRVHVLRTMVVKVMNMLMSMPTSGARKMKSRVLVILSLSTTSLKVKLSVVAKACAMAAPAKPPMRVCELEDGMPYHQVSRFQMMAAMRPLRITGRVMNSWWTVLLMVLATAWSLKIQKAAKLKRAAHSTAWNGVSTLVLTTVAMELAASWKPLM